MADTKNTEWFESWFDSEYYHLLYAHRDEKEAADFLDRVLAHLGLVQGLEVLDLACGKGRHALHLHQRGYTVTGLDLSENSIASLRHQNSSSLHFQTWDMREPYADRRFDAVFNLFTSFGYFNDLSDNLKTLKAIRQALRPNGHFLIDFLNVEPVLQILPAEVVKTNQGVRFETRKFLESGKIKKDILIHDGDSQYRFQESVQALTRRDFEGLLHSAELELDDVFGDYHLNAFDANISPRLILLGHRPA